MSASSYPLLAFPKSQGGKTKHVERVEKKKPAGLQKPTSRAAEKKGKDRDIEKQWQAERTKVLKRDGWKCRHCKSAEKIEVHHLKPRSLGGPHENWNLVTLCAVCHAERHAYRLFITGTDANKGLKFEAAK